MLNYNHLYYFHIAAQEGSVGAAAAKLGVTQPTVSEQLRTLERSLGTPLFDRHPTGLTLNAAGRIAFEHTSVMFRIGERLLGDLGGLPAPRARTLRVGISGTVARSTSSSFLLPLLSLECTPVIRLVDCTEMMRALRNAQMDLVVCENTPSEAEAQDLVVHVLERTTLLAVAQPSLKPAPDWSDVSLVQFGAGSRFRWAIDAYLAEHKLTPTVAAEADDACFLLEAAASGTHVAVVPANVARDAVAAGRVRALAELPAGDAAIHAIYRRSDTQQLAARAATLLAKHR